MKTIILAAGQGFQLDGCCKLLLRDPLTGERIIDQYRRFFAHTEMVVVVGYKAVEIMQRYPQLEYVYNADWKMTNNSYSAALALDESPCYVVSCDLFLGEDIVPRLEEAAPDCVLTARTEYRQLNALNASVAEDGRIVDLYQGEPRRPEDPEAMGIFKISTPNLLREWKINCIRHSNLFVGQNLPFAQGRIMSVDKGDARLEEVNTVLDYLRILEERRRLT